MIRTLLLIASLLLSSHSFAAELTIQDLVAFEHKINKLAWQPPSEIDFPATDLNRRFNKAHRLSHQFASELRDKLSDDSPLNGYQINKLRTSLGAYLTLSSTLNTALIDKAPAALHFQGSDEDLRWLIASIDLVQSMKAHSEILYGHATLRRTLKDLALEPNSPIAAFETIRSSILSKDRVHRLAQLSLRSSGDLRSNHSSRLQSQLESKAFYQQMISDETLESFYSYDSFASTLNDTVFDFGRKLTHGLSAGFGYLAGPIEWRKGWLHQNGPLRAQLEGALQPLDLLLEKKRYKLTDYTIPGYWGHIAVWLGTEAQLKSIGIWDHPILRPFQSNIRQGHSIYEVRREGVRWSTLDDWLNLDAIGVLRLTPSSEYESNEYAAVYQKLFRQQGKKFDYSFDAMTASATTCTEIISFSYGPINWPTSKVMGRHVLQPDSIASLAFYQNSPIEWVLSIEGTKSGAHYESAEDFAEHLGIVKTQSTAPHFTKKVESCQRIKNHHKGIHHECTNHYQRLEYSHPEKRLSVDF